MLIPIHVESPVVTSDILCRLPLMSHVKPYWNLHVLGWLMRSDLCPLQAACGVIGRVLLEDVRNVSDFKKSPKARGLQLYSYN